jgi:hypothetical protein
MPVEENHAGPALAQTAPKPGTLKAKVVAQQVKQRRIASARNLALLPIDLEDHQLFWRDDTRGRPLRRTGHEQEPSALVTMDLLSL